jgi:hypothetical protein
MLKEYFIIYSIRESHAGLSFLRTFFRDITLQQIHLNIVYENINIIQSSQPPITQFQSN